jgi:RNA polymerase sigma-70 factor, ECF subfamily
MDMGERQIIGLDDDALIRAAQSGDMEAFSQLYQRHFLMVYRYALARVHDGPTAEDIVEKVFMNVFRRLESYRLEGNLFTTYLYRVARNTIIDYYRVKDRIVSIEAGTPESAGAEDLDQHLMRSERLRIIQDTLAQLSPDYQEVIRLRILLELPTATVAEFMERSPGAVRILLHRALKALREQVGESGEEQAGRDSCNGDAKSGPVSSSL